jgi:hypothetical protein
MRRTSAMAVAGVCLLRIELDIPTLKLKRF